MGDANGLSPMSYYACDPDSEIAKLNHLGNWDKTDLPEPPGGWDAVLSKDHRLHRVVWNSSIPRAWGGLTEHWF